MLPRVRPWPKIIAAFVGGVAVSGGFGAWGDESSGSGSWIVFDWHVFVVSALLLIMTYPLVTRREWARRVLLSAVALIGVALLIYYAFRVVAPISFSDLSPEEIKVERLSMRLTDLSLFFLVLTLLVFGVSFLSHPDIVATFQRRPNAPTEV